jgi:CYTH domain-containing protein
LEVERRFLVTHCPNLAEQSSRLLTDHYVTDTRLRLRSSIPRDGSPAEFKLCKKYEPIAPSAGPIVNVYLTEHEYSILSDMPTQRVCKRRYHLEHEGITFALDVFLEELEGLMLCETEGVSLELLNAVRFPPWATIEVTDDEFFTGGNLSKLTNAELRERLLCQRPASANT